MPTTRLQKKVMDREELFTEPQTMLGKLVIGDEASDLRAKVLGYLSQNDVVNAVSVSNAALLRISTTDVLRDGVRAASEALTKAYDGEMAMTYTGRASSDAQDDDFLIRHYKARVKMDDLLYRCKDRKRFADFVKHWRFKNSALDIVERARENVKEMDALVEKQAQQIAGLKRLRLREK
jgi:hypothetical protein